MNDQTITVSLPYYRCREQVGRAVESILSQSYPHLRVVVVNDGDPDPPWEELRSIGDPRLVLFTLRQNHGCFFAHQVVLDSTPDCWIALQDADDWSEPERLEKLIEAVRAEDSDGAVSAMIHHIPFGGLTATQIERHPDLARSPDAALEYRGCLMGLFNAGALRSAGGFGAGFRISYDKLLFNLLLMTSRISWVDEPLYNRAVREGSLTTSSESGIGSREWQRVNRKLQSIYASAYKEHRGFCDGRIPREQFLETIRLKCAGSISRRDRKALAMEAERLRTMLDEVRTSASQFRPRTVSITTPRQQRYRATALRDFPFGPESSLVYCPVTRQVHQTANKLLDTVARCRQMDTLGNHALALGRDRRIQSVFGSGASPGGSLRARILQRLRRYSDGNRELMRLNPAELASAAAEISEVVRLGLMVSEGDLIDSVMSGRKPPPPPLDTVGIVTRDRPDSLEKAVRSVAESRRAIEKPLELVIVDRSDASQSQAVIAALESVRGLGASVRYTGEKDVANYARRLAQASGVPLETVEFALAGDALYGVTTGASRNALLLDSAGQLSLQIDDDAVACLAHPPAAEPGVAFSSNPDPTEFWFFESRESLMQSAHFRQADVAALHETLLGKPLSGCVDSTGGSLDLRESRPLHDELLLRGGPQVLVTCAGIAGDSGIGATGYFFVDPASRRRLTKSEEFYRAVVESRQVMRTVRKPTVCPGAGFLSFNIGLDHRELLPPFMPVMRGSDAIFSAILRQVFPDAAVGFLPQCLRHLPAKPRSQDFEELWSEVTRASFSTILLLAIGSCPETLRGQSAVEGLRRLGSHLVTIASSPLDDFEEFLRTSAWRSACGTLGEAERFLQKSETNGDFLRNYQRRYLALARQSLLRAEYVVPRDLMQIAGFDRARSMSRELVRRFGEVLESWPALVAAAKSLRAADVRPGTMLSN
jgi:glycosyltransferase involved in cell wall biosynthesis